VKQHVGVGAMKIITFVEVILYTGIVTYILSLIVPYGMITVDFNTNQASYGPTPEFLALAIPASILLGVALTTTIVLLVKQHVGG